jgi:hypothetical protein
MPNDLVMSNEDIAAELSSDGEVDQTPESVEIDHDPSEDDVESTWEDALEGEEGADQDQNASSQRKAATTVRKVKANGQIHEVNMADTAAVDRLLSLGLGARQVFTERDKLKKQLTTLQSQTKEAGKYRDLWNKLEAAKSDRDGLYEKIFGEKFGDADARFYQQQQAYESATPEEKRIMDLQRKLEAQEKSWADRQREIEDKQKEVEELRSKTELKELRSMLTPEFHKFEFSSKVKDSAQAAKLNKALWKLAIAELKEQGDLDELPPEMIRKAFKDTHDMLWASSQQSARQEMKAITEEKKTAAKQQAQVASTRNYNAREVSSTKEKDPVKLFRKMFR